MSTIIRPEVSKKNQYWVERNRYYELKHFCLQYLLWKRAYALIDGFGSDQCFEKLAVKNSNVPDPTPRIAELLTYYSDRIKMVEDTAKKADSELAGYILKGVTQGVAYDTLKVRDSIPCCKDVYYAAYRRFFWLLDKARK